MPPTGTATLRARFPAMLKLAGIFLLLMILFGILGFIVNVAGAIAKLLFFVFLVGFVVSLVARYAGKRDGGKPTG
jgi:uncharacterized membrane protein YtjA (UPF0391 family)